MWGTDKSTIGRAGQQPKTLARVDIVQLESKGSLETELTSSFRDSCLFLPSTDCVRPTHVIEGMFHLVSTDLNVNHVFKSLHNNIQAIY